MLNGMAATVLLTGGAGFVGINLAEELLKRGYRVVIFDCRKPPEQLMKNGEMHLVFWKGNVLDTETLHRAFEEYHIDYVIHGAAITPGKEREKQEYAKVLEVNIQGTVNVLEAARLYGSRRFLYISSIAVYGDVVSCKGKIEEEDPKKPSSVYEISKFAAEKAVMRYGEIFNMDFCSVRLGDVFGPWETDTGVRDTLSAPYRTLKAALDGKEVRLQKNGYNGWAYVRDIAIYISDLLEAERLKYRTYNCGIPFRWSITEWCRRLQHDFPQFTWALDFNNEEEMSAGGGMLTNQRIQEDTGYLPQYDMEEAAKDYIEWLRWFEKG